MQITHFVRENENENRGGQPDSKADIVDDHQDLVGKLKAEF
jgi:hypothetical protein